MAQLKELVVNGPVRIVSELFAAKLGTKIFYIPSSSNSATKGVGTSGQVLKSNGTTVYWGNTK